MLEQNFPLITEPLSVPSPDVVPHSAEIFLEVALALGGEFLSCGGPVTRLENQLSAAGALFAYETSVHATPSSLMISCHRPDERRTYSRFKRIESFAMDLGHLRSVDKLLNDFADGRSGPTRTFSRLKKINGLRRKLSVKKNFLSMFGIGASAGILSGAQPEYAFAGGLLTGVIDLIVQLLSRHAGFHQIFHDFLSCILAFFLSRVIEHFWGIPSYVLSIGTLAFVVPGLLMTTGISEVVDQNYLSGTIRLLKTLYTFLAMALAYYLAGDLMSIMEWSFENTDGIERWVFSDSLITRLFASVSIIFCFSVKFRAHKKSIRRILLCGLSGAAVLTVSPYQSHPVLSSFVSAFAIGIISFWLSRRYRHPSQIYSVPSILSLVPGMLAFSSFGYQVQLATKAQPATGFAIQAMLISLAIVFGLAAGRIPLPVFMRRKRRTFS